MISKGKEFKHHPIMSYAIYDEVFDPTKIERFVLFNCVHFKVRYNIIIKVEHNILVNSKTIYYNNFIYKHLVYDDDVVFRIQGKKFKLKFGKYLCPHYKLFYCKLF